MGWKKLKISWLLSELHLVVKIWTKRSTYLFVILSFSNFHLLQFQSQTWELLLLLIVLVQYKLKKGIGASICIIPSFHPYFSSTIFFMDDNFPSLDDTLTSIDNLDRWKFYPWIKYFHPWTEFQFVIFLCIVFSNDSFVTSGSECSCFFPIFTQKHDK